MRAPGWEDRVGAVLAVWRRRAFVWGKYDCCRFAAAIAIAQTGKDPMRGLRSAYRGKAGALRLIAEQPLADRLDALFKRMPLAFAKNGDIIMADGNVGVIWGDRGWFLGGEGAAAGLVSIPRTKWTGAWRCG